MKYQLKRFLFSKKNYRISFHCSHFECCVSIISNIFFLSKQIDCKQNTKHNWLKNFDRTQQKIWNWILSNIHVHLCIMKIHFFQLFRFHKWAKRWIYSQFFWKTSTLAQAIRLSDTFVNNIKKKPTESAMLIPLSGMVCVCIEMLFNRSSCLYWRLSDRPAPKIKKK